MEHPQSTEYEYEDSCDASDGRSKEINSSEPDDYAGSLLPSTQDLEDTAAFSTILEQEEEASRDTRLLNEPSSPLLPLPKDGDWVQFIEVDAQGQQKGEPRAYRLSFALDETPANWSSGLDACLRQCRKGEMRALLHLAPGQAPVRVQLTEHIPRFSLSLGLYLDVTEMSTNMLRPSPGAVLFYRRDGGEELRMDLSVSTEDPLMQKEKEALLQLKVRERGLLGGPSEVIVAPICLELLHVSQFEDISPLQDGTLWKLCLGAKAGSFEQPEVGQVVTAVIDSVERTWACGRSDEREDVEIAVLQCGNGERTELYESRSGHVLFELEITHIAEDPKRLGSEEPSEELVCAAAKEQFTRNRKRLALLHWQRAGRILTARRDHDDDQACEELLSRVKGNLSVCFMALGQPHRAMSCAQESVDLRQGGEERAPRAVDWIRLAKSALACCEYSRAATACEQGLRCKLSQSERAGLTSIMRDLHLVGQKLRRHERAFCQRIFAKSTAAA